MNSFDNPFLVTYRFNLKFFPSEHLYVIQKCQFQSKGIFFIISLSFKVEKIPKIQFFLKHWISKIICINLIIVSFFAKLSWWNALCNHSSQLVEERYPQEDRNVINLFEIITVQLWLGLSSFKINLNYNCLYFAFMKISHWKCDAMVCLCNILSIGKMDWDINWIEFVSQTSSCITVIVLDTQTFRWEKEGRQTRIDGKKNAR